MQAITGFIISLLVEGAKRLQAIPISPTQIGRIRTFGVVLSVIATLITAYSQGQLVASNALPLVGASISTWLLSVLSYHGLIKTS